MYVVFLVIYKCNKNFLYKLEMKLAYNLSSTLFLRRDKFIDMALFQVFTLVTKARATIALGSLNKHYNSRVTGSHWSTKTSSRFFKGSTISIYAPGKSKYIFWKSVTKPSIQLAILFYQVEREKNVWGDLKSIGVTTWRV